MGRCPPHCYSEFRVIEIGQWPVGTRPTRARWPKSAPCRPGRSLHAIVYQGSRDTRRKLQRGSWRAGGAPARAVAHITTTTQVRRRDDQEEHRAVDHRRRDGDGVLDGCQVERRLRRQAVRRAAERGGPTTRQQLERRADGTGGARERRPCGQPHAVDAARAPRRRRLWRLSGLTTETCGQTTTPSCGQTSPAGAAGTGGHTTFAAASRSSASSSSRLPVQQGEAPAWGRRAARPPPRGRERVGVRGAEGRALEEAVDGGLRRDAVDAAHVREPPRRRLSYLVPSLRNAVALSWGRRERPALVTHLASVASPAPATIAWSASTHPPTWVFSSSIWSLSSPRNSPAPGSALLQRRLELVVRDEAVGVGVEPRRDSAAARSVAPNSWRRAATSRRTSWRTRGRRSSRVLLPHAISRQSAPARAVVGIRKSERSELPG